MASRRLASAREQHRLFAFDNYANSALRGGNKTVDAQVSRHDWAHRRRSRQQRGRSRSAASVSKSFSATDIFLAGLKGMKNVLLLGTPSGGGSAATQEIVLGATPLRLRIGSMASFQADGKLFDGNGIQPDVLVEPVPEYYIGGRDNVLEEAVKRIRATN
jgi:peptidase S41-like protein